MPFITSRASGGFGCVYSVVTSAGVVSNTAVAGEQIYSTPGTYSWTCPTGVNIISVLAVGGGGGGVYRSTGSGAGGGGGLGWKNGILVTPGLTYTVVVGSGGASSATVASAGGNSYFIDTSTVAGFGGSGGNLGTGGAGGSYTGAGGGTGGAGGSKPSSAGTGGGGAAGYSGNGGAGGSASSDGSAGTGGGAGGGGANGGGGTRSGGAGVGIYGEGTSGAGGSYNSTSSTTVAKGGSGGQDGQSSGSALYGGGGAGTSSTNGSNVGGGGVVRIIWAGPTTQPPRNWPSTRTFTQPYSVQFNGSNQYLSLANATALYASTSNFTIECWVYITSFSKFNHIWNKGGGIANGIYFGVNTSGILQCVFGASNFTFTGTNALTLNKWTHVAITRGATNIVNLWKDGVKENTDSATSYTLTATAAELRIGRGYDTSTDYFSGSISNLRWVKGTAVYTGAFTPPVSALDVTAATELLTCNNSTIVDGSANAFAITSNNTPTVSSSNPFI